MDEAVYDVFARKSRGDPLTHIGYLSAPGDQLARIYAWKTYDEENWFEMCVVPRESIIAVNRTDGPFAAKGSSNASGTGRGRATRGRRGASSTGKAGR